MSYGQQLLHAVAWCYYELWGILPHVSAKQRRETCEAVGLKISSWINKIQNKLNEILNKTIIYLLSVRILEH